MFVYQTAAVAYTVYIPCDGDKLTNEGCNTALVHAHLQVLREALDTHHGAQQVILTCVISKTFFFENKFCKKMYDCS